MDFAQGVFAIVFFVVVSAFFSASEVALLSLSRIRVRSLLRQGVAGAGILHSVKERPHRMVIVTLVGSNVSNVLASVIATDLATKAFGSEGLGVAAGVMSFVILSFTDIIPKSAATIHNERISLFAAPIISFLEVLLTPVILFFEFLIKVVPGVYTKTSKLRKFTEEELKAAFDESFEDRTIDEYQRRLLFGVLEFNNLTARDAMTPAEKCVVFREKDSVSTALEIASVLHYSHYPVLDEKDKVIGVTSYKRLNLAQKKNESIVGKAIRQPLYAPAEAQLPSILSEMFDKKHDMAIVVDEKEKFLGAITIHDLVEELIAEVSSVSKKKPVIKQ